MIAVFAAAFLGAATLGPSLPDIVSTAAFHVYQMPSSAEPENVKVLASDAQSRPTSVKIDYRLGDRLVVTVVETMRAGDDAESATASPASSETQYIVNGYPATYVVTGPYYQRVGWLTWTPPGVTVTLSSMDMVDVPVLVNVALALY